MEQKIAELQTQINELKELVGVRPEPKKRRKADTRHWEGLPEVKSESIAEPVAEPEKDLITRVNELESDVNTMKEQIKIIFREFESVHTEIQHLKRHHPFSY